MSKRIRIIACHLRYQLASTTQVSTHLIQKNYFLRKITLSYTFADNGQNQEQGKSKVIQSNKCFICEAVFDKTEDLTTHCNEQHKGCKYECQACGKKFRAKLFLNTHIKETCEGQSPHDGVSNPESDEDLSTNDGVANQESFEVLGFGPPETPSRNTIWATNFNEVPNPVLRLAENSQNQVPKTRSKKNQHEVIDDNESDFADIEDLNDEYEPKDEDFRQAKKDEKEDYDDDEPKPPKGIVIPYNVHPHHFLTYLTFLCS